ncbi:alpha/beta hydrolase family protein [Bifidobacterium castoris]|uniref:Cytochrome C n=1 Tax=Bifidobacterium castoris TaxID=2306972 RepID=A0A430F5B6_9BIFI|nr:hypothetical protein [Bifidobacterium castoris]RSX45172.1 cytochrome C [Bifidobacterium castoris]
MQHFWKQFAWTLVVSALTLALFLGVGALMMPSWRIEPLSAHLTVSTGDTAIAARDITTPQEGTYKVKESKIRLAISGGQTVDAIVREPIGAPQGRPACSFVHGAGTGNASEVYADIASAMASAGITTLVQDKRLDNYTSLSRDYMSNAEDYLAGLDALRDWPGVDRTKAGIYAESEGTWIATLMADRDKDIAFAILTSAPVFSPRQQMAMAATQYLNIVGAPSGVINIIPKLISLDFSPFGLAYADFDAAAYRHNLTMPLLVNYGTRDPSMPCEQGAQKLIHDAHDVGNENVTVRYYPTNHQMRTGSSLSVPGLQLEQHYTHNLEDWVNAVAAGATAADWTTPPIAGAQPFQEFAVPANVKPGCVHSLLEVLIVDALVVLLWLIVVIGCCVAFARRRHCDAESPGRKGRTLVHRYTVQSKALIIGNIVLTPALTCGFLAYFVFVARAALRLEDHAAALEAGWIALRIGSFIAIMMLCWLWVRLYFFYGPGELDPRGVDRDGPRKEYRMARGHSWIIGMLSACVLLALTLADFFGMIGS